MPWRPRWLIFMTKPTGVKGSLATGLPSNRELRRAKTTTRTRATTAPDLNLKRERSREDSLRLDSTRSIFLDLEGFLRVEEAAEEPVVAFMDSSFLEALSMEERRVL